MAASSNHSDTKSLTVPRLSFSQAGQVVFDTANYHLVFRINLRKIRDGLAGLTEILRHVEHAVEVLPNPQDKQLLTVAAQAIQINIDDIYEMLDTQLRITRAPSRPTRRLKRSVVIPFIGSIFSLGYTACLHQKVNGLEDQVDSAMKIIDLTTQQVDSNTQHIRMINETIVVVSRHVLQTEKEIDSLANKQSILMGISTATTVTAVLREKVSKLCKGITAALHGHIDPNLVSVSKLGEAMKRIQDRIPTHLTPAVNVRNPAQLYALTAIPTQDKEYLNVFVDVPLINPGESYQLWRYHGIPIPIQPNISLEITNLDGNYLVSNPQLTLFRESSQEDLEACQQIGNLYLCTKDRILYKRHSRSCLFALVEAQSQDIRHLCGHRLRVSRPTEIHSVGHEHYLLSLTGALTLTLTCGTDVQHRIVPAGISQQHFPSGCAVSSRDFYIPARTNESYTEEPQLIHIPLPYLTNVSWPDVLHHQPDELQRAYTKLLNGQDDRHLTDLRRELLHHRAMRWTSVLLIFLGTMATASGISMVAYLWLRYRRAQRNLAISRHFTFSPPPQRRHGIISSANPVYESATLRETDTNVEDDVSVRRG